MPRRRLAWAELRVGILVLASFTTLAIAIVLISGRTGIFTTKYTLKTYLPSASGLKKGSLVWLAGIEVGNIHDVNISPSPDPNRAVEVILRIDKSYEDSIREDSVASLGSIGLLGDKYVDISRGTRSAKVIPPNGEVKGLAEADIKKIIQNSNDLVANLGDLVNKINQITTKIDVGQGTLGKFINDPSIFIKINTTVDEAQKLILEAKSGEGSIGKLIGDPALYDRLNGTLIRLDNVMAKVESGDGTLGKFVSDPAVFNRAETLLTKFNVVADRMEKGEGFLGKLSKDETLYAQIRDTMSKFSTVADRMTQGEGTVGKLFVDPSLYSNLNNAAAEVVKLLYDFRQNPKRFLRIKFGLF
jgi:phospholipid/cholesterol/gamma-HCH transport system substrate-binding protein